MKFQWNENKIRFMSDAAEYGSYNKDIAEIIHPFLNKKDSICEAGCGLGYLSIELSHYVKKVTAVDINRNAINVLQKNINHRNIHNINAYCGDVNEYIHGEPFDSIIFYFFGSIQEILKITKAKCKNHAIIFMKNYSSHRFSVNRIPIESHSYKSALEYLNENNIPCIAKEMEIAQGQPFKSLEDAYLFFHEFSQDENKSIISPDFVKNKLIETNDATFPYYMPHNRAVGFLVISVKDL